jgi:hypothetical protein
MSTSKSSKTAEASAAVQDQDRAAGPGDGGEVAGTSRDGSRQHESAQWHEPARWKKAIVYPVAAIWNLLDDTGKKLRAAILGAFVAFVISVLKGQSSLDPRTWYVSVSQYLSSLGQNLLVVTGVLAVLIAIAVVARLAYDKRVGWDQSRQADDERRNQANREAKDRQVIESGTAQGFMRAEATIALQDYGIKPLAQLAARDCGVSHEDVVYQLRDSDTRTRQILREVASRGAVADGKTGRSAVSGISIVGRHHTGKSRLVWETLSSLRGKELLEWTFVQWPPQATHPFPIELMERQRVVILLDRLEELAQARDPRVVNQLNGLVQLFADKKIPLIIIATCDDVKDSGLRQLAPLLALLEEIDLDVDLTEAQAKAIADYLCAHHEEPHDDFDGTPGSIIDGVVTSKEYQRLSVGARHVMKVLKLFASAEIGGGPVYVTKARACAVADAIFDVPRLRWRAATDELIKQGSFVSWQLVPPSYERVVWLTGADAIESVSDYPFGLSKEDARDWLEIEDWPLLNQVLEETHDADALVALGDAWTASPLPLRLAAAEAPSGQTYLERAAECYRTALEVQYRPNKAVDPYTCALTEWRLAGALLQRHYYMETTRQSPTRLEVLQAAAVSYQAALEYFTYDEFRENWISLMTALTESLNEQSLFLVDPARAAQLEEARTLGQRALQEAQAGTATQVSPQIKTMLARNSRYRARLAKTQDEAVALAAEAHDFLRSALDEVQTSDPEARNKEALADAQTELCNLMRFQASRLTGEARANQLTQVEDGLRTAIRTLADTGEEPSETRIWAQSSLAETLLHLARQAATPAKAQPSLREAEQLSLEVMNAPISRSLPDPLARIRGVYAGILTTQAEYSEASAQALLEKATYSWNQASQVDNQQSVPEDWAGTRFNGALLALQWARLMGESDQEAASQYLSQARGFLADALSVYGAPAYFGEQQQALAWRVEIEQNAKKLEAVQSVTVPPSPASAD